MANHGQLLRIRIARAGIAIIERNHDSAIRQRGWIGTLIEVTGGKAAGWVEEVAEEADGGKHH